MLEVVFALLVLSGLLKAIPMCFGYEWPLDPTLVLGCVTLLVACYEALVRKNRPEVSDYKKRFWRLVPFVAFGIWWLISLAYTASPGFGITKTILLVPNVLVLAVPFLVRDFSVQRFAKTMVAGAVVGGFFSLIAYGYYSQLREAEIGITNLELMQSYYLKAGEFCGMAMFLALLIENKYFRLFGVNVLYLLLLATAARGPILFGSMLLLFAGIRHIWINRGWSWKLVGLLVVLNVAWGSVLFLSSNMQASYNRSFYRVSLLFGAERKPDPRLTDEEQGGATSVEGREDHFGFATGKIFESAKSIALGYGAGSYNYLKTGQDGRGYPHNLLLEVWFELGLVGTLFLAYFLLGAVLRGIRNHWMELLLCFAFLSLNSMKSLSITDQRALFAVAALLLFMKNSFTRSSGPTDS